MSLSLNKQYEIVFLHEHSEGLKWGYAKIASYIHCSKSTIVYWIQKYWKNKDLTDEKKSGNDLVSLKISKPLLSEKHRVNRLKWAKNHKNFDWKKVIFTDESTFQLFQSNRKVWQFSGRRKIFHTVKHPQKVHVWGCFSILGFGKLICFERNLNSLFMCNIYERGLLTSASKFFEAENIEWILQEDNDPKHHSKICKRWKEANEVTVLPWPSMFPD
ncbi:IS630 family transposase [Rhizophagus clarus]|uniref:IS630 family transposase n=1 Tax=Rhizophagus clarus TaxID=94130 RepID=A0A8H3M951_9GLOM|nr:IS630 family transposase [Rhizophagus clarus]